MTFFGAYRGPAWETAHARGGGARRGHGAPHPTDPHAHGQRAPAEPRSQSRPGRTAQAHDAHDAMRPWTWPRRVARAARIADGDDVPADGAGRRRHRGRIVRDSRRARRRQCDRAFPRAELHRARDGHGAAPVHGGAAARCRRGGGQARASGAAEPAEEEVARRRARPDGLLGARGRRRYRARVEVLRHRARRSPSSWPTRFAGAHRLLSHKYYVDELYNATVIAATWASARGLWTVDRNVVDGAVNGAGRLTVVSSWFSGLDRQAGSSTGR